MAEELKVKIKERNCKDDGNSLRSEETEETFLNKMFESGWICTVIREDRGCDYNVRFYYFYPKTAFQL